MKLPDHAVRVCSYGVDINTFLHQRLEGLLHPKSLQYLLLREHYKDPTLTQLKNTILGNLSHLAT